MKYFSICSCEAIRVQLSLPRKLEEYAPRSCDCEFCSTRHLNYISDPQGRIVIHVNGNLEQIKQGAELASFWQCSSCYQFICVTYDFKIEIKGAVSGALFECFRQPVSVSPKTLFSEEKLERWGRVWLTVKFIKGKACNW